MGIKRTSPEEAEIIRQHWPTMTSGEISRLYGLDKKRVEKYAQRQGLKHDEATVRRIHKAAGERLSALRRMTSHEENSRRMKRLWRQEYRRMMEGEPQKTRIHLARTTKKAHLAINNLVRKYDYYRDELDPYTLRYDRQTDRRVNRRRRIENEKYYTEKYHIKFKSYDED